MPDDGRGLIIRLWNPGDHAASAHLSLPSTQTAAGLGADLLERDLDTRYPLADGTLSVPCGSREFVTVRLLAGK